MRTSPECACEPDEHIAESTGMQLPRADHGPVDFSLRGGGGSLDHRSHSRCGLCGCTDGNVVWKLGGARGPVEVRVDGNLRTNNTEAVHAAVIRGLGIAVLPTWLVGQEVQSGQLAEVLGGYQAASGALDTGIHALYPAHRHLSSKVRAFVDFLADRFAPHPYWEKPPHAPGR